MNVEKKKRLLLLPKLALAALLGASLAFTGCPSVDDDDDDDEVSTGPIKVSKLALVDADGKTEGEVPVDDFTTLTLTLKPATATNKAVTWSAPSGITLTDADGATVSETDGSTATVTASVGADAAVGETVSITATSEDNPSATATYKLKVLDASTINLDATTLSATSGEVGQGLRNTVTVNASGTDTANPGATLTYTYKWTANGSGITLENADSESVTIVAARTAAVADSTVTVTVKATSSAGGSPKTKKLTYALHVYEVDSYPYELYKQDFADVASEDTKVGETFITAGRVAAKVIDTLGSQSKVLVAYHESNSTDHDGSLVFAADGYGADGLVKLTYKLKLGRGNVASKVATYTLEDSTGTEIFKIAHDGNQGTDDTATVYTIGGTEVAKNANMSWTELTGIMNPNNDKRYASKWLDVTVIVDFTKTADNVDLLIKEGDTTLVSATGTTDAINVGKLHVNFCSLTSFAIDDILIKSSNDALLFSAPVITVGDGTSAEAASSGNTTLSALAATHFASDTGAQRPVAYDWELSGDTDVATFVATAGTTVSADDATKASTAATTSAATVTLATTNNTLNNKSVTVKVIATPEDNTDLNDNTTKTVTIKADESLFSAFSLTRADSSDSSATFELANSGTTATAVVNAGDKLVLTPTVTAKVSGAVDAANAEVTYSFSDCPAAVTATTATNGIITLEGAAVTDSATVKIAAKAGDVTKTITVTVKVQDVPITAVSISGRNKLFYGVADTTTLTATTTPSGVSGVTYEWTVSGSGLEIDGDNNAASVTIKATSANATGSVSVIAKKSGSSDQSATYSVSSVTLSKANDATYSENFASMTAANFITTPNLNTESLIVVTDGVLTFSSNSGNVRNAHTKNSPTVPDSGAYVVEFDLALTSGNANNRITQFALLTKSATNNTAMTSDYLFAIENVGLGSNTPQNTSWYLNEAPTNYTYTSTPVTLEAGKLYHYAITIIPVENEKPIVGAKITDGDTVVVNRVVTPTTTSSKLVDIDFVLAMTLTKMSFDNLAIYALTE